SITVQGDCPIYALERALQRELSFVIDEEIEVATIAGLILHTLGAIPKEGVTVSFPNFSATIERIQGARIKQVRIRPINK
ncbi:MAG: hypothetical protein K2Q33_01210, partial [Gammaproteobacteria bacterium]|nr:hypothetical protein [Gammaproteobacteria bacterium]